MKVSIITTVLNRKETIKEAIKSVLSQTYPDIEYIIVDGGSTDGTLEIIEKHKERIGKFISEKDKGLFDGLNKGIKLASGQLIGILHSDDIFYENTVIEEMVRCIKENNADLGWGDLIFVDKNNPQKVVRYWKSSEYKEGIFKSGWMPPHVTFFAKKEAFEKYGYYNLDLDMAADYELMFRFLEKYKLPSCYLPKIVTIMRTGGVSDWSLKNLGQILKNNWNCYRAWKVNGLKPPLSLLFIKPLKKLGQLFKKVNQNEIQLQK